MKTYKIRLNNSSRSEDERWKILTSDGKETWVSNVFIDGEVNTSKDYINESVGYKWNMTCHGDCVIKNNVAYITTPPKGSAVKRHILKTISYRFLGTITTVLTAYILGAPIGLASLLGVGEIVLKPILYFLHERFWYNHIKIK